MTSVSQIGTDRIIEIQFSDGQYKLFLEFYAGGNIVLTDKDLTVLSLFRNVTEGPNQEELRIGLTYSLRDRQNYNGIPLLTKERLRNGLQDHFNKAQNESSALVEKPKKRSGDTLRRALASSLNEFPPTLIDHVLRVTAFDPSIKVEEVLMDDSLLDRLMLTLVEAQSVISDTTKPEGFKGYIVASPLAATNLESEMRANAENASENVKDKKFIYEAFHPFRPQQFVEDPEFTILEFSSFNQAVDEFFSSAEAQKLESRLSEREENARKRLGAAKQDLEIRVSGLKQVQEMHTRKAQAIETNLQQVQEAMNVINGLIAQGMDWIEIARLIEMEQARHNAIAEMIKLPLKLFENTVTLLLLEGNFDDGEDFEGDETGSDVSDCNNTNDQENKQPTSSKELEGRLAVDIDLALSPWSNARQYYGQKKSAAIKEQKTLQSSAKAVKSTEKKINADLRKGLKQEKQILRPIRKPFWFEKYYFFISSENFLVLAAKDTQQSEILYKKHLGKGDIFVHADLNGAMPVIIKNNNENSDDPVPPSTIEQAGTLAVATSTAWDSKAMMSAWWVKAEQVSKFTTDGDLLNPGEFFIRDSKTFLPPAQLLLGFGVLFYVSEESKVRHLKHRFSDDAMPKYETFSQNTNEGHESDKGGCSPLQLNITHCKNQDIELSSEVSAGGQTESAKELSACQSSEEELSETVQANSWKEDQDEQPGVEFRSSVFDKSYSTAHYNDSTISDQEINPKQTTGFSNPLTNSSSYNAFSKSSATKQAPFIRGKKGKYRKIKDKYANQNDEDRAFALNLLGSTGARKEAEEALKIKSAQDQYLAQKQKHKEQHALTIERSKEIEEIRKSNFNKVNEVNQYRVEEHVDLEAFWGAPLAGDEILDILVLCGPWESIGKRCRWRAKLQPGPTKKGKAVKEILGSWTAAIAERGKRRLNSTDEDLGIAETDMTNGTEEQLLNGIREREVVNLVPVGTCRVSTSLGNASGTKSKGGGAVGKGHRGGRGSKKPR